MSFVSDATCAAASSDSVVVSDGDDGCTTVSENYNGKISAGKDTCSGDSGTVKSATSQHELVGVVSW